MQKNGFNKKKVFQGKLSFITFDLKEFGIFLREGGRPPPLIGDPPKILNFLHPPQDQARALTSFKTYLYL